MAKYMQQIVTVILIAISYNSLSVLSKRTDPSLEIIKHEDAEEGYSGPKQGNNYHIFSIQTVYIN